MEDEPDAVKTMLPWEVKQTGETPNYKDDKLRYYHSTKNWREIISIPYMAEDKQLKKM